jgi:hypothetical protein
MVQHMPPSRIYLNKSKCLSPSKDDIIQNAKTSKYNTYTEDELEKLYNDYVSSMKSAEEMNV